MKKYFNKISKFIKYIVFGEVHSPGWDQIYLSPIDHRMAFTGELNAWKYKYIYFKTDEYIKALRYSTGLYKIISVIIFPYNLWKCKDIHTFLRRYKFIFGLNSVHCVKITQYNYIPQ